MSNNLSHAAVLGRYCGAFVDALVAAGVEHVCLCPGSRSTPLALTFARHPQIKVWTHLDERSCAYFALGIAKASQAPVAILCSSGTAAANFAPAVIEAYHSHAPLIVLTADRPPELQEVGANQTIDQHRLYGSAVKWFLQMPLPEASEQMLRYVSMVAARAVATARSTPPGPAHLNFPFREPLMPAEADVGPVHPAKPAVALEEVEPTPATDVIDSLMHELAKSQRGIIVCGPQDDRELLGPLEQLALLFQMPVLADPLSQLRTGLAPEIAIGSYDNFLREPRLASSLAPDFVLRFGAESASRSLRNYLQLHASARQILVTPGLTVRDSGLSAGRVIQADARLLCQALLQSVGTEDESRQSEEGWLSRWLVAEQRTRDVLAGILYREHLVSEPGAVWHLAGLLPGGATVFAGNSMPVRDLDSFYPESTPQVRFLHNRGASGIDGVLSTALGAAAVSKEPLVLVTGDLSFYHDMNGLLAARRFGLNATIVLINNDGGGIFSFLPQHEEGEHFEDLWGTPHGLDFAPVADLYGVGFRRVTTREEYRAALKASFDAPGVQIIEIKTDREENLRLHQHIWDAVAKAVAPLMAK